MDHLELLENKIHDARIEKGITPTYLVSKGFVLPTVYRIEKHGNYLIDTLFKLLDELGIRIRVGEQTARNEAELGEILRNIREDQQLTHLDIIFKSKLTAMRIVSVEKGRNYEKKTLNSYLDALGIGTIEVEQ